MNVFCSVFKRRLIVDAEMFELTMANAILCLNVMLQPEVTAVFGARLLPSVTFSPDPHFDVTHMRVLRTALHSLTATASFRAGNDTSV